MPPTHLALSASAPTIRILTFPERKETVLERARRNGVCVIACKLGRSHKTSSQETRRNPSALSGDFDYRAVAARSHAGRAAQRAILNKLESNLLCSLKTGSFETGVFGQSFLAESGGETHEGIKAYINRMHSPLPLSGHHC